jgi:hypothetical protein
VPLFLPLIILIRRRTDASRLRSAPITHSPPHDPSVAVEIPPRVKRLIAKFRELRAQGRVAGASRDEPMQAVPVKSLLSSKK